MITKKQYDALKAKKRATTRQKPREHMLLKYLLKPSDAARFSCIETAVTRKRPTARQKRLGLNSENKPIWRLARRAD